MCVGYTIRAATLESIIEENWCLLDNQATLKTFVSGKYLSNIRDAPDGQYLCVHCNSVVT